jgi:hypothetical protein
MSGVFQNIDPSPPGKCVLPAFGAGGGHTRWVERGWGGQYFGRRRHSFVLNKCKYFVANAIGAPKNFVPTGKRAEQEKNLQNIISIL